MISIPNYNACIGLFIKSINIPGIAPINGPNTGIILVTPTIVYMSTLYGNCSTYIAIKVNIPIIIESNILPIKKLVV